MEANQVSLHASLSGFASWVSNANEREGRDRNK